MQAISGRPPFPSMPIRSNSSFVSPPEAGRFHGQSGPGRHPIQLEISGRVSEGNDFVKKIICIPREQAPAPPCSKKDKSTDRINRLRGG